MNIELSTLKTKLEWFDERLKFLEKNWVDWTKSTRDVGASLLAALEEKIEYSNRTHKSS
jgi:hypothetical protein